MKLRQLLIATMVIAIAGGITGCGNGNNDDEFKETPVVSAQPSEAQDWTRNLSDLPATDSSRPVPRALNFGTTTTLNAGNYQLWKVSMPANAPVFATTTPSYGDIDIYVLKWTGSAWQIREYSDRAGQRLDRVRILRTVPEDAYLYLYARSNAAFGFSVSWETATGGLHLDVPYFNQNTLATIGSAACSSASTAMILAVHGKIELPNMASAARDTFNQTATIASGLLSRDLLINYLKSTWGFAAVTPDTSGWSTLYATIQREIRAGRPLILGNRSMSSAGHYLVVAGFKGSNYSTATVIVNDPNGVWKSFNSWSTSASGQGVEYPFTTITSKVTDGVLTIVPVVGPSPNGF